MKLKGGMEENDPTRLEISGAELILLLVLETSAFNVSDEEAPVKSESPLASTGPPPTLPFAPEPQCLHCTGRTAAQPADPTAGTPPIPLTTSTREGTAGHQ